MPIYKQANNCLNCPYQSGSFSFLNLNEKMNIQQNCTIVNFKKGENIVKQGEKPSSAIYVSKGLVKIFTKIGDKEIILKLVGSWEYTALSTVFDKTKYSYSFTAVENSRICLVDSVLFKQLAKKNMDFMIAIAEEMAKEVNFIQSRLVFLQKKNINSKLAEILLYLSNHIYKNDEFLLTLTRKELGEFMSLSREHTTRLLSKFAKEKLIAIDGKEISILDKEALVKHCESS